MCSYARPRPTLRRLRPPSRFVRLRRLALVILVISLQAIKDWLDRLRHKLHNLIRIEICSSPQSTQSQSRLLSLPAEIRVMIWTAVITEDPIILFRRNGRISYDRLTAEHMYSNEIIHITPDTIEQLNKNTGGPVRHEKAKILAVLQTCQMM